MKKVFALVLTVAMILALLAACGNSGTADNQAPDAQAPAGEAGGDGGASASGSGKYNVTWEDTEELYFLLMCPSAVPTGLKEVEDAINEITMEEIDCHVTMEMVEIGNYIQQVSLKMSAQEKVDVMLTFPAGPASFTGLISNGQLMDITDLIDTYAPSAKELAANQIGATTIKGRIYALPIVRDVSSGVYIAMRTDVLEDLGLVEKAENLSGYREFGDILEAVHSSEKWGNLAGVVAATAGGAVYYNTVNTPGLDSLSSPTLWDPLMTDLLVVDPSGSDPTVKFIAETDAFREIVALGEEWYNKGYIYKDANTSSDAGFTLIKDGKAFSTVQSGELGFEVAAEQGCGMDMTVVKLLDAPITTAACNKFTWAVPNSSTAPEAAVTFMEMLYTDERINNLLAWGIEGRDYVINVDGQAEYPEGVTEPAYHGADFIVGNQYITVPWVGSDLDLREQAKAVNAATPVSYYLGFTFDTADVETDTAAVNSIYEEYRSQIGAGIEATAKLDEYIAKQHANGLDNVIAAAQAQLDQWVSENK